MGQACHKRFQAKGKWVQRPNRKIIKSVSGTRATWHVTGLLSNRVISYLQAWHRISCSGKEADHRAWKVPGAVLVKTEKWLQMGEGRAWTRFAETRLMKREVIWNQSGRRSGRWRTARCCGSAALTPSVCHMEGSTASLRSDTVLLQPYVFMYITDKWHYRLSTLK